MVLIMTDYWNWLKNILKGYAKSNAAYLQKNNIM